MSTYLITGIAGFIGSSLARTLLERGEQVRGIDNFSTGKPENISEIQDQIDFREADLLELGATRQACRDVDYVLHHAAIPSVPRSIDNPLETNRSSVDATVNLLVGARDAKVRRVVYAASSSAYGDTPTLPKTEDMAPNPISPYAVGKLAGEHLHDLVLPLLRSGDGVPALLQRFWATPGSVLAVFRRAGEVHHANAGWRTGGNFRRWQAQPRFHLRRERGQCELASLQSVSRGCGGQGVQYR